MEEEPKLELTQSHMTQNRPGGVLEAGNLSCFGALKSHLRAGKEVNGPSSS